MMMTTSTDVQPHKPLLMGWIVSTTFNDDQQQATDDDDDDDDETMGQ
jgi:hypothetical protein